MSPYEKTALEEIHAWKRCLIREQGIMRVINRLLRLDRIGEIVYRNPLYRLVIQTVTEGLITLCNDFAQKTVRKEVIYSEFREKGYKIAKAADIFILDLQDVDRIVNGLDAKYKAIACGEGAGTGVAGWWGIALDVIALVTLNLRAIGEYATYYGFEICLLREKLFALQVLTLASSPIDKATKITTMAQLVKIAQDVAKKRTWSELEKNAAVKAIRKIAETLGLRLTKAKLAEIIPLAGAVIGGGFNAYFTSKVCRAASYLYRERFLAEKYGPDVINPVTQN